MSITIVQSASQIEANRLNPDTWVDKYFDFLFIYTIKRVGCHEQAKDIVQETFMAGLLSAKNFKGHSTERTWLVAILKRKIVDHYRKVNSKKGKAEISMNNQRFGNHGLNWIEEFVADSKSTLNLDFIENEELGDLIEKCISKLPEKHAKAFVLKTIRGYSTEVVCDIMGINQSNLWVILHRSRTVLQKYISQSWYAA